MSDTKYMKLALALAEKGRGHVNPNPTVGAVIVKDGEIIGQGYHEVFGGPHAERNALNHCTASPRGATLYVTLEPCCHFGKTPPCTEAIIQSGISRVVIGTLDPNPKMSGNGAALLRAHQISIEVGVLEEECKKQIREFRKWITTGKPFVFLKYAMTLDGKIATRCNRSKWITGEKARLHVQKTRGSCSAIMVGVNTILQDDPMLTCRMEACKSPIRIICDTHLKTPLTCSVVQTAGEYATWIATCSRDEARKRLYEKKNCKILNVKKKDHHVDLSDLMTLLGRQNVSSVLLEGGGTLHWSALKQQIVDEAQIYIAPKIFGGEAHTAVGGAGVAFPGDAFQLKNCVFSQIGSDYLIEGEVIYPCLQESLKKSEPLRIYRTGELPHRSRSVPNSY